MGNRPVFTLHMTVSSKFPWANDGIFNDMKRNMFGKYIASGQIIATSHDLTPIGAQYGKSPYFREV